MKIKFASILLNENSELPKDITIETRRQAQTEFPIDSQNIKIFDRKNQRINVSFVIERTHNSEDHARFFALTHSVKISQQEPAILEFFEDCKPCLVRFNSAIPTRIKTENNALITSTRYEFVAEKIEGEIL